MACVLGVGAGRWAAAAAAEAEIAFGVVAPWMAAVFTRLGHASIFGSLPGSRTLPIFGLSELSMLSLSLCGVLGHPA